MDSTTVTFKDIKYTIQIKERFSRKVEHKEILHGLTGTFLPGDMVALMGPSGAGKSTLLNVLAGIVASYEGEVKFIGGTRSSFVQQEDLFYPYLTVKEHLRCQARFRIPKDKEFCYLKVDKAIETFNLSSCVDTLIGSAAQGTKRGISGGEKKRLSVASELFAGSPVIFADEPTSGLDSHTAESVVEVLKKLALRGHTVISTIHQPSYDILTMFNKVLLVAEGNMVYLGPVKAMVPYFNYVGHPCPPFTNPADFVLELLAIDYDNYEETSKNIDRLCSEWHKSGIDWVANSKWASPEEPHLEKIAMSHDDGATIVSEEEEKSVHHLVKLNYIMRRQAIDLMRNPAISIARIMQTIFVSLVTATIYFRLKSNQWYSKAGSLYILLVSIAFQSTGDVTYSFCLDCPLLRREQEAGLYPPWLFFIGRVLIDIPVIAVVTVVGFIISYWLIGLRDHFSSFVVVTIAAFLAAFALSSFGYIAAAIGVKRPPIANALAPLFIVPMIMVHPFVTSRLSLAKFWYWLYYLSPFTHMWKLAVYQVFSGVDFGGPGCVPSLPLHLCTGDDVLRRYEIHGKDIWWYIVVTLVVAVMGRICAGVILGLRLRSKD